MTIPGAANAFPADPVTHKLDFTITATELAPCDPHQSPYTCASPPYCPPTGAPNNVSNAFTVDTGSANADRGVQISLWHKYLRGLTSEQCFTNWAGIQRSALLASGRAAKYMNLVVFDYQKLVEDGVAFPSYTDKFYQGRSWLLNTFRKQDDSSLLLYDPLLTAFHNPNFSFTALDPAFSTTLIDSGATLSVVPNGSTTPNQGVGFVEGEQPPIEHAGFTFGSATDPQVPQGLLTYPASSSNIDLADHAGTLVMHVRPSWAGNDNQRHDFFDAGTTTAGMTLYKGSDNRLTFTIYSDDHTIETTSLSIAGWLVNDQHTIAAAWRNTDSTHQSLNLYVDEDRTTHVESHLDSPWSLGSLSTPLRFGILPNGGSSYSYPADATIYGIRLYNNWKSAPQVGTISKLDCAFDSLCGS